MKSFAELLNQFRAEIAERGHPSEIVWLQARQLWLTREGLRIFVKNGFPYEFQVEYVYEKCKEDLDCGAALSLLTTDSKRSYCTLLLDTFGSDDDVEVIPDELYLSCDPYCSSFRAIHSPCIWFLMTKIRKNWILSSLDYAFVPQNPVT